MTSGISIRQLADQIRQISRSDPSRADKLVADHLDESLDRMKGPERLHLLQALKAIFEHPQDRPEKKPEQNETPSDSDSNRETLSKLTALLLGKPTLPVELSSDDLLKELVESMNAVFDLLDRQASATKVTLSSSCSDNTTHRVVQGDLDGAERSKSLQAYLEQIEKAILMNHKAFQQAAITTVAEILNELDPKRIAAGGGGGMFRPGLKRKAEAYDAYTAKWDQIRQLLDSGQFLPQFIKTFEKYCQILSLKKE